MTAVVYTLNVTHLRDWAAQLRLTPPVPSRGAGKKPVKEQLALGKGIQAVDRSAVCHTDPRLCH